MPFVSKQKGSLAASTHGTWSRAAVIARAKGMTRYQAGDLPRAQGARSAADDHRSEGQFNTVVYEDYDRFRGQDRRDVIMIAKADRERLGLAVDQRITVRSACGEMANVLVREVDIRAGDAAIYYPEANALVPRAADPESGTPAFKNAMVELAAP